MKRSLLSMASALALAAAVLPTSADAQFKGAVGGGGGRVSAAPSTGGAARMGGPPASAAASARSVPLAGNFAMSPGPGPGGKAFVAPSGGQRFVAPSGGGQRFVQGNIGNWQGGNWPQHRRHHFHGAAFGFVGPAYYDYAAPYDYSDDYDDGCYQLRPVETVYGIQYRRIWVCN
jgi:hypothetical protein